MELFMLTIFIKAYCINVVVKILEIYKVKFDVTIFNRLEIIGFLKIKGKYTWIMHI